MIKPIEEQHVIRPRSMAGQGYAHTYLKTKAAILEERMAYAEQELLIKYKSEVGYRAELKALYGDTEAELDALRKERQSMSKAADSNDAKVASRRGGSDEGGSDYRMKLFQEKTKLAQSIAEESTKVSAQRIDLITKSEGLFTAPVGATDQISRAAAGASSEFKTNDGRVIDAAIDNFLQNDASLPAAFNGLTDGQKQAAAIHLYRSTASEVVKGKSGSPLTDGEAARIKSGIAKRFGVPAGEIDDSSLALAKEATTEDYLSKAGSSLGAMKAQLVELDKELKGMKDEEAAGAAAYAAGSAEREFHNKTSPDKLMQNLYIEAISDDGRIDADEIAAIDQTIASNVDKYIMENSDRSGKVMIDGVPFGREELIAKATENYISDPNRSVAQNLELQYLDDPRMQTYKREGELMARKGRVGNTLETRYGSVDAPAPVAAPMYEDLQRRTAEIYYPERSRMGFEEANPAIRPELARSRRAMEQGVPSSDIPGGAQKDPMGAKVGAIGARAPVSNLSRPAQKGGVGQPVQYKAADAMFDITMQVQSDINSKGRFTPRAVDEETAEYQRSLQDALKSGQIKPTQFYDEVTRITGSGLYDTPEAAAKAKEDILFNINGDMYQRWLDGKPKKPE